MIDLPELLRGEPERFRYFLRFVQRAASEEGRFSLKRHLEASEQCARKVGDSLRGRGGTRELSRRRRDVCPVRIANWREKERTLQRER